jgi:ribosomal protein S18 acetylase RimI-like enzyme
MLSANFEPTLILKPLPTGWVLRPRRREDLPAVVALMQRVYLAPHAPEAVWPEEVLLEHLEHFPEGQFSILDDRGRLVADATSMKVASEKALRPHRWSGITGAGTLAPHDPDGDAFYGVDLAVDPAFRGRGLARHLYAARIALAMAQGCRRFVAGARIPGYHLFQEHTTPQEYLQQVERGLIYDPTLSIQLHLGFTLKGLLPDYITDPESLNFAAHIVLEF